MFPPPEEVPSTTDMEMRKKDSVELIREAMPILTGLAQVYTLRIPSDPIDIPYLNETTLHDIYFCHSSLRPSALVIHDFPVSTGCLHVITVYANQMLFPI
ncbi:MAG TPA: hypothetical protein VHO48_08420, partial [Anaerolineaceae bacterium]|nr:hypothetical protein [Anaerolineaceae bacterium]